MHISERVCTGERQCGIGRLGHRTSSPTTKSRKKQGYFRRLLLTDSFSLPAQRSYLHTPHPLSPGPDRVSKCTLHTYAPNKRALNQFSTTTLDISSHSRRVYNVRAPVHIHKSAKSTSTGPSPKPSTKISSPSTCQNSEIKAPSSPGYLPYPQPPLAYPKHSRKAIDKRRPPKKVEDKHKANQYAHRIEESTC
jgi:hypothetical protein